ncbi:MAG: hypothetical protein Q8Q02_10795 [Nocardioides sp.]|nr:hypothetical protein [Nocardioides sp.]
MTTWGVYGIYGRTATHATVAENDKDARRWFVRWRVDGVPKKRTFPTKGYARTFHDQLMRAKLMGWEADEQGWPIDPTGPAMQPAAPPPVPRVGPTFADYCTQVWWPIVGPTFGDKNMLGHRNNMRTAIDLLVYRDGDSRTHGDQRRRVGGSIYLSDLVADDLRMAVVARRSINRRTATVNTRRLAAALENGDTEIDLPPEVASPATVQSFYVTLSMIIKAAARSGHLTGDPLDGVANLAPAARSPRITDRMVPSIGVVFDLADAIATLGPCATAARWASSTAASSLSPAHSPPAPASSSPTDPSGSTSATPPSSSSVPPRLRSTTAPPA